jgi:hypothetical protein
MYVDGTVHILGIPKVEQGRIGMGYRIEYEVAD